MKTDGEEPEPKEKLKNHNHKNLQEKQKQSSLVYAASQPPTPQREKEVSSNPANSGCLVRRKITLRDSLMLVCRYFQTLPPRSSQLLLIRSNKITWVLINIYFGSG